MPWARSSCCAQAAPQSTAREMRGALRRPHRRDKGLCGPPPSSSFGTAPLLTPLTPAWVAHGMSTQAWRPSRALLSSAAGGRFLYYREAVSASHGASQRKLVTPKGSE